MSAYAHHYILGIDGASTDHADNTFNFICQNNKQRAAHTLTQTKPLLSSILLQLLFSLRNRKKFAKGRRNMS